jgi:hypothetical protein
VRFFLTLNFLLFFALVAQSNATGRLLCYDRFVDEIYSLNGDAKDDVSCRAMLVAGTLGICFQGEASEVVKQMNQGQYVYSPFQKVLVDSASLISDDAIQYGSYEGDFAPLTRLENEIFRCPHPDQIKEFTTLLADAMNSSVESAVGARYRDEFGMPFWLIEN